MITVYIINRAMPSLLKDCEANGITYVVESRGRVQIEDSGKGRMAIRMVRERFGLQSIKVQTQS